LRHKSCDCDKIALPQGFPRNCGNQAAQHSVIDDEQVTTQKSAIKILFSLMAEGKMSSQMNPLAKGDFKAMLAEFRSVEIQASAPFVVWRRVK
jgi:hypothetical protein